MRPIIYLFNATIQAAMFLLAVVAAVQAKTKPSQTITIAYFSQEQAHPPVLANLDPFVPNQGILGAELAVADNNTTGQFTGQKYVVKNITVAVDGNIDKVFKEQVAGRYAYALVDLPAEKLLKIADLSDPAGLLLFDVATSDDLLRGRECRSNVLHVLPSRAMRADALAQYMVKKRWTKWFLLVGKNPEDRLFADAVKRAAQRYHLDIIEEKSWERDYDARRTAQSQVPVLTQADDYDVLAVADEQDEFGDYLEYRTWLPRLVIGTQGLVATAWHRTHEQWGAVQIQKRFKDKAKRWMEEKDYAAYLAVRAIGEAVTRGQSFDLKTVKAYLLSDKFALQGYKGTPLSFRPWDGQLRQPVLLAAPRSLVAVAPIEGFLHQTTELDTLGYDQPETQCHWKTP